MTVQTPDPIATTRDDEASVNTEKYLSFFLGNEEYAMEILSVREIIGLMDITPLPQTPEYVKGVINLRGKIIPVIELRSKFNLTSVEYTEQTCVIVVEVGSDDGSEPFAMGLIVDSVREVLDICKDAVEPPPTFGCNIPLSYIEGIGKVKEKVIVLLNVDQIVTSAEVEKLRRTSAGSESETR